MDNLIRRFNIARGNVGWESKIEQAKSEEKQEKSVTLTGTFKVNGKDYRVDIKLGETEISKLPGKNFEEKISQVKRELSSIKAKNLAAQWDAEAEIGEQIEKLETKKRGFLKQKKEIENNVPELDAEESQKGETPDAVTAIRELDKEIEGIEIQLDKLKTMTPIQETIGMIVKDAFGSKKESLKIQDLAIRSYEQLAAGKEKKVIRTSKSTIRNAEVKAKESETVFYLALKNNEKALKKEHMKMKEISGRLSGGKSENLALEAEEMEKDQGIKGRVTLQVRKASDDFEEAIKEKVTTFDQRVEFGEQYVRGLRDLHSTGFAYGDPKPENCLVYDEGGGKVVKISDFGKSEEVGNAERSYKGNLRFAPPEGKLSKKGDVWGAAMILIRNFEEPYLADNKKSLYDVESLDRDEGELLPGKKERRGVERFVVEHKAFVATERTKGWKGLVRYVKRQLKKDKLSPERQKDCEQAMHQYISNLGIELEKDLTIEQAKQLTNLLKEMTNADPSQRPTMEAVVRRYEQIMTGPTEAQQMASKLKLVYSNDIKEIVNDPIFQNDAKKLIADLDRIPDSKGKMDCYIKFLSSMQTEKINFTDNYIEDLQVALLTVNDGELIDIFQTVNPKNFDASQNEVDKQNNTARKFRYNSIDKVISELKQPK